MNKLLRQYSISRFPPANLHLLIPHLASLICFQDHHLTPEMSYNCQEAKEEVQWKL